MWRVAVHLMRSKALVIGVLAGLGLGAGTEYTPMLVLPALALSASLLGYNKQSDRVLRTLPLASRKYASAFWLATMAPVILFFPLAGLAFIVCATAIGNHQHSLASLITLVALLGTAQGSLLIAAGTMRWYVLQLSIGGWRRAAVPTEVAGAVLAAAFWAYVVAIDYWRMDGIGEDACSPFPQPNISVLTVLVGVLTFAMRQHLFAQDMYPSARLAPARLLRKTELVRWSGGASGFSGMYSVRVRNALALFVVATAVLSPQAWNPEKPSVPSTVGMTMVAMVVVACGVRAMPSLRDLRILPLTTGQLTRRMAGFALAPSLAIAVVLALPFLHVADEITIFTSVCFLLGWAVLTVGMRPYLSVPSSTHAVTVLAVTLPFFFVVGTQDYPHSSKLLLVIAGVGIVYAVVGTCLQWHAITRSSRAYRASGTQRVEGR